MAKSRSYRELARFDIVQLRLEASSNRELGHPLWNHGG